MVDSVRMSEEETQKLIRNLAAATSKSILESLEAARKTGIPFSEMRSAISKTMTDNLITPIKQSESAVAEYAADPTATSKKYEHMKAVEGEYRSASEVLRQAGLLDAKNKWVDGKEPNLTTLSSDSKRAVKRFKAAETAAIRLGVVEGEAETTLSMRALRGLMRQPIDFDVKLLIVLAGAPVVAASMIMYHGVRLGIKPLTMIAAIARGTEDTLNAPDVLEEANLLTGPKYAELLEWMEEADSTIGEIEAGNMLLLPYIVPDIADLETINTPAKLLLPNGVVMDLPVVEAEFIEDEYSAVVTPKQLAAAIQAAKNEPNIGAVSKGASI